MIILVDGILFLVPFICFCSEWNAFSSAMARWGDWYNIRINRCVQNKIETFYCFLFIFGFSCFVWGRFGHAFCQQQPRIPFNIGSLKWNMWKFISIGTYVTNCFHIILHCSCVIGILRYSRTYEQRYSVILTVCVCVQGKILCSCAKTFWCGEMWFWDTLRMTKRRTMQSSVCSHVHVYGYSSRRKFEF